MRRRDWLSRSEGYSRHPPVTGGSHVLEAAGLSRLDMVKIRINRPLLTEILRRL